MRNLWAPSKVLIRSSICRIKAPRFPTGAPHLQWRSYSKSHKRLDSKDGWWAILTMTFSLPCAFWLYNHRIKAKDNPQKPIILEDLGTDRTKLMEDIVPIEPIQAHYVLMGGGTSSIYASISIREQDPKADILIISDEDFLPYKRPPLSKELWLNRGKSDFEFKAFENGAEQSIFYFDNGYYEVEAAAKPNDKRTRILLGKKIIRLDTNKNLIYLDDGSVVNFKKALYSLGSKAKNLELVEKADPEIKSRIITLRNLVDYENIKDIVKKGGHIAIIGGGFLGSELAISMSRYSDEGSDNGVQISQIFPEYGNMALVFPQYLSRWTMSQLKASGVNIVPNSDVVSIQKTDGDQRIKIGLSNGDYMVADNIIVAIGAEPNIRLAREQGIEIDEQTGGLNANSFLQVKGDLFAAGDAISFYDPVVSQKRRIEHYEHAILSGKLAGYNMVHPDSMREFNDQAMFWSDLGPTISYEAVGLVDSHLTTVGIWADSHASDPNDASLSQRSDSNSHKRYDRGVVFYVKDRQIVGLLFFNIKNQSHLAKRIIKEQRNVQEIQQLIELFPINQK